MSNWQSCNNCYEKRACDCMSLFPKECRLYGMKYWKPIPCPLCGGALSKIMEHKTKIGNEEVIRNYRHCFSCHMEFYEQEEEKCE